MPYNLDDFVVESEPSGRDSRSPWRIRRAGAIKPLKLVVLSADYFGIRAHFYGNRTVPHYRLECPACKAGNDSRWKGYTLAWDCDERERVLWEFTPGVQPDIAKLREKLGTIRGCQLRVTRAAQRNNARLQVEFKGVAPQMDQFPEEQPIIPILFHIWGIEPPECGGASVLEPCSPPPADTPPIRRKKRAGVQVTSGPVQVLDDLPGQMRLLG